MADLASSFEAMFKKIETYATTKTVVGEPIHMDGVIIVPLVDVSIGVGAGSVGNTGEKLPQVDGSGGGMSAKITPSAVIVVVNGTAQLINVKQTESVNKLIDMVPGILSKLNLSKFLKKDKAEETEPEIVFEQDSIKEPNE